MAPGLQPERRDEPGGQRNGSVEARAMVRPAYLIMVHHKPYQFEWLLNAVHHPDGVYLVHVDLKTWSGLKRDRRGTAARVRSLIEDKPNIRLMRPRSVNWGGWSQSQLALDAIDQLLDLDPDWTHFINLSGQCYPTRSMADIRERLGSSREQLVELRPFETLPDDDWHLRWIPMLETPVRAFALPGRRRPPRDFKLSGKGSQWVMLTREFCMWRRSAPVARRIARYLRGGWLSDEQIVQALVENSPFAEARAAHYGRYIVWPGPKVLTGANLPSIRSSPALYGRKFDAGVDCQVLHELAEAGGYRPGPAPHGEPLGSRLAELAG
jgi:hypothetical protein